MSNENTPFPPPSGEPKNQETTPDGSANLPAKEADSDYGAEGI